MGAKRKAQDSSAADGGSVDWRSYPRRPFKRGFIEYLNNSISPKEAVKRRAATGVQIVGDGGIADVPPPVESFEELGVLPPWVLEALRDDECHEPKPIQAQSLPIALAGQNLIGVTADPGRSLAYLLPAIVHIEDQPLLAEMDPGPVALVLVPTRESAVQIAKDATKVLQHSIRSAQHSGGMQAVSIHEGGSRKEQLKQLGTAGVHIIAGTPGRLYDLAAKDQLSLLRVTFFVIDGADQLIEAGLLEQVHGLASWIRPERQTAIFSKTWPKQAQELASQLCYAGGEPVHISTGGKRRGNNPVGKTTTKEAKVAQKSDATPAECEAEDATGGEPEGTENVSLAEDDFPEEW